jgi:hypothetical protein
MRHPICRAVFSVAILTIAAPSVKAQQIGQGVIQFCSGQIAEFDRAYTLGGMTNAAVAVSKCVDEYILLYLSQEKPQAALQVAAAILDRVADVGEFKTAVLISAFGNFSTSGLVYEASNKTFIQTQDEAQSLAGFLVYLKEVAQSEGVVGPALGWAGLAQSIAEFGFLAAGGTREELDRIKLQADVAALNTSALGGPWLATNGALWLQNNYFRQNLPVCYTCGIYQEAGSQKGIPLDVPLSPRPINDPNLQAGYLSNISDPDGVSDEVLQALINIGRFFPGQSLPLLAPQSASRSGSGVACVAAAAGNPHNVTWSGQTYTSPSAPNQYTPLSQGCLNAVANASPSIKSTTSTKQSAATPSKPASKQPAKTPTNVATIPSSVQTKTEIPSSSLKTKSIPGKGLSVSQIKLSQGAAVATVAKSVSYRAADRETPTVQRKAVSAPVLHTQQSAMSSRKTPSNNSAPHNNRPVSRPANPKTVPPGVYQAGPGQFYFVMPRIEIPKFEPIHIPTPAFTQNYQELQRATQFERPSIEFKTLPPPIVISREPLQHPVPVNAPVVPYNHPSNRNEPSEPHASGRVSPTRVYEPTRSQAPPTRVPAAPPVRMPIMHK